MRASISIVTFAAAALPSLATEPFLLAIDEALSSANFELCVGAGNCDSDSSGIAGGITIDLNSAALPTQMNLFDYDFQLTNDLGFFIDFGFGGITVTATDLTLSYPNPGVAFGPAAIEAGVFEFVDVPAVASGVAAYDATLLACLALELAGVPCQDVIDLSTLGEQSADALVGTISIIDGEVTVVIEVALTLPVLPDDPDLAQLSFVGTIVATGAIPGCGPGDFDCDGDVDVFDFGAYVACESGPGGGILFGGCERLDFDADGDVDLHDYAGFQVAFDDF